MTEDTIKQWFEKYGQYASGKDIALIKAIEAVLAENTLEGKVVMTHENFKSVWDQAQAEEREACAKVCDDWYENRGLYGVDFLAREIRARGNT